VDVNPDGISGMCRECDPDGASYPHAMRQATCRKCGRDIIEVDGVWCDPRATGDDEIWRELCDATPEGAGIMEQGHEPIVARETFTTPFSQYAERDGQPFEIVGVIAAADDHHDQEVLPMYLIRFPDGEQIEAWPEEVLL
jgi:hypothetical protein